MKSTLSFVAAAAVFAVANAQFDMTLEGCYSSIGSLTLNGQLPFNSRGSCGPACAGTGAAVMGMTNKVDCYCGQKLPPASSKVDNSKCSYGCAGYDTEACGGPGFYSIYLSGKTAVAPASDDDVSSSSAAAQSSTAAASSTATKPAATTTASPSVVTVKGQTVVVTAGGSSATSSAISSATNSATSSPDSKSSGGGPSKAGIAAGVVVGVVVIAAILGGLYFFMRNRKRRDIEEEYKRSAAVNTFIAGGKPPNSSGGASSFTDMRLDPAVMAQRRMSDGSIADNQDYSRRILKVTNA